MPSGHFYRFVQSSGEGYFGYTHNRLLDSVESKSLSTHRRVFKGICLSGDSGGLINYKPKLAMFNDGKIRWEIKFRIKEELYSTTGTVFTDILPDPLEPGISREERNWRIDLHPSAFSEVAYDKVTFQYGTIITIKQLSDLFIAEAPLNQFVRQRGRGRGSSSGAGTGTVGYRTMKKFNKARVEPYGSGSPWQPQDIRAIVDSLKKGDGVLIFGDSQSQQSSKGGTATGGRATIGKTLADYLKGEKEVTILGGKSIGNHSKSIRWYLSNFGLIKKYLEKKPKMVFITLGGNGGNPDRFDKDGDYHPAGKDAERLIDKILNVANKDTMAKGDFTNYTQIVWIGPPMPAEDGSDYRGADKRRDSFGGLTETLYSQRWDYNKEIESNLQNSTRYVSLRDNYGKSIFFINGYSGLSDLDAGSGYRCNRACDGLHLVGGYVLLLLYKAGIIDEKYYRDKVGTFKAEEKVIAKTTPISKTEIIRDTTVPGATSQLLDLAETGAWKIKIVNYYPHLLWTKKGAGEKCVKVKEPIGSINARFDDGYPGKGTWKKYCVSDLGSERYYELVNVLEESERRRQESINMGSEEEGDQTYGEQK